MGSLCSNDWTDIDPQDTKADETKKLIKYKNHVQYKLLLLGAGECGKTTLLRQMRHLHGQDFNDDDLLQVKPDLIQNVIESMRTLAIHSQLLFENGHHDTKVNEENEEIRARVVRMSDKMFTMNSNRKFTKKHCDNLTALWDDIHIRNVLEFRHTFQLSDTCEYLFDRMHNYWRDDYVPTFEELVHCRRRTTGINKIKFELSDHERHVTETFEIFDVGGQKTERRKWPHVWKNTSAIIFIAALSGYNQTLWEDAEINRMANAINLFGSMVKKNVFKGEHIIMFLNKMDLFEKKVVKHSVKEYFNDYKGRDCDKDAIIEFFKQKFKAQLEGKRNTEIHFHITCATDTMCVKRMFASTRAIIIKKELISAGFGY